MILIESEIRKFSNFIIYPRDFIIPTSEGFVIIDDGQLGGTHWICFYIKDFDTFYFDSFGDPPDHFLLNPLPKPINYQNTKVQDINSKLFSTHCLYFFYLKE